MGIFATFKSDAVEAQIKLWNDSPDMIGLPTIRLGDAAPAMDKLPDTYTVKLREGGYLNVVENTLDSHTDKPLHEPVYDKWGQSPPSY